MLAHDGHLTTLITILTPFKMIRKRKKRKKHHERAREACGSLAVRRAWPVFTTYKWRDLEIRIWAGVTLPASNLYISLGIILLSDTEALRHSTSSDISTQQDFFHVIEERFVLTLRFEPPTRKSILVLST